MTWLLSKITFCKLGRCSNRIADGIPPILSWFSWLSLVLPRKRRDVTYIRPWPCPSPILHYQNIYRWTLCYPDTDKVVPSVGSTQSMMMLRRKRRRGRREDQFCRASKSRSSSTEFLWRLSHITDSELFGDKFYVFFLYSCFFLISLIWVCI